MRIRVLFFLSALFFSNFVFSEDFYWKTISSQAAFISPYQAATPALLCSGAKKYVQTTSGYDYLGFTLTSSVAGFCSVKNISTGSIYTLSISLFGSSCPVDTIYNSVTGACEAPPPICKVGDPFPAKGSVGPVVTMADGRNYTASTPPTACFNQCTYSPPPDVRPVSCYGTAGGQGWCNYIIKSTGANCSADSYTYATSGPPLNPSDTPNVPPSDPDPLCPDGWGVSGGTCYKLPPKPCDPSTGAVCAPGTTDPNKPPPNPGAGGNPGQPGEGAPGGPPDSSSGSDSDLGDLEASKPKPEACKPKADGTGCAGSTVKGEQCDKDIVCTGDAVQCAMLRQQKKTACAYEYSEARPFIEQQVAKDAYKLTTTEVSGGALFSAGLNAPRWLPASCPAPKSISIKGVSTSLSFEPSCQFASALGPLFVALAGVFFAVYVGRAFGGS